MKYKIKFLPETISDRNEIKAYLAQYSESTVKKFFTLLKIRIEQIRELPYSCPLHEDEPDFRKLVVGDYLVFYMINEEEKAIKIHRIFHGTQDIKRRLN